MGNPGLRCADVEDIEYDEPEYWIVDALTSVIHTVDRLIISGRQSDTYYVPSVGWVTGVYTGVFVEPPPVQCAGASLAQNGVKAASYCPDPRIPERREACEEATLTTAKSMLDTCSSQYQMRVLLQPTLIAVWLLQLQQCVNNVDAWASIELIRCASLPGN